MSDINKISGIENNSKNFETVKQNDISKTDKRPKQIVEQDTFSKSTTDKNTNETEQTYKPNERFSTGNENLVFKVVKLKFYPEDQEKMDKMSVEDRIAYRRELKKQNRYIVVNEPETEM